MRTPHQAQTSPAHNQSQTQSDGQLCAQVSEWSYRDDPAVRELLDHLAEELAREYVRLMEASTERKEASE